MRGWAIPLLPTRSELCPSWSAFIAKRRNRNWPPDAMESWKKKQTGQATSKEYRTRPQLAREVIQVVASWLGPPRLRMLGDSEYAGGSISRHLPVNTELISRMTMNAALHKLPPLETAGRGRRRKKGARSPSPTQMAQDPKASWTKTKVHLYGRRVKVWYRPSTRYGIPAPAQGCCVSLWSAIPVAAAATIACSLLT
jgi:hypothetical protein